MDSTKTTMESLVERLQRLHPLPRGTRAATASIKYRPHGPPEQQYYQIREEFTGELPWEEISNASSTKMQYVATTTIEWQKIEEKVAIKPADPEPEVHTPEKEQQAEQEADTAAETGKEQEAIPEPSKPAKRAAGPIEIPSHLVKELLLQNEGRWCTVGRGCKLPSEREREEKAKPGPKTAPSVTSGEKALPTPIPPTGLEVPKLQPTAESVEDRMKRIREEHRKTTEAWENGIRRALRSDISNQPVHRVGLNIQAQTMNGTSVTVQAPPRKETLHSIPTPRRNEVPKGRPQQRGTAKRRGKVGRRGAEVEEGCWRCRVVGHCHSECLAPQKWPYCYRCGRPYYTVDTCPECSGTRYGRY
ncbi:uncharacterized protein LOC143219539 [Lasioglossum baleicum]|uniref:uncharacterized protein LOC143219539 n=1 Tax=Lasioglossum baleicum TaxID=434251 RepID=UPI003FCDF93C